MLFENIQEFHAFLTQNTQERIRVQSGTLHVLTNIVGKTKEFTLPLYPIELSPEEQLKKNLYELEVQLKAQNTELSLLKDTLKDKEINIREQDFILLEKEAVIQEKDRIIDRLKETLKEKECENKKLAGRIRQMECAVEELM